MAHRWSYYTAGDGGAARLIREGLSALVPPGHCLCEGGMGLNAGSFDRSPPKFCHCAEVARFSLMDRCQVPRSKAASLMA